MVKAVDIVRMAMKFLDHGNEDRRNYVSLKSS